MYNENTRKYLNANIIYEQYTQRKACSWSFYRHIYEYTKNMK